MHVMPITGPVHRPLISFPSFAVPADDKINRKAGVAIREFVDLVYPADYVPGQKRRVSKPA